MDVTLTIIKAEGETELMLALGERLHDSPTALVKPPGRPYEASDFDSPLLKRVMPMIDKLLTAYWVTAIVYPETDFIMVTLRDAAERDRFAIAARQALEEGFLVPGDSLVVIDVDRASGRRSRRETVFVVVD